MAKFNQAAQGPKHVPTHTHEGGEAVRPANPLRELEFTAAVTFAGEDTFYESGKDRLDRVRTLTQAAMKRDPASVAQLVADLRSLYQMRSITIVVAAEYVRGYTGRGPLPRHVVSAALQRADEPAEFLAYWHLHMGRSLPAGVKKGLADAMGRLVNERAALKWNSKERAVRLADVLELTHPEPFNASQSALFKALLDERHQGSWPDVDAELLPRVHRHLELAKVPEGKRRSLLKTDPEALGQAEFTWERLSSWLPGGMDAEAWEAIIPTMGVMALLRNLRNFDQAGISEPAIDRVIAKVTSAEDVKASRILPFRTYQAYIAAPSDNWKRALGKTLNLASGNVPAMDGSLLVIDLSQSMSSKLSQKSQMSCAEAAALQAVTVARNSKDCDIVIYAMSNEMLHLDLRGASVLDVVKKITSLIGKHGGNTMGHTAIRDHFDTKRHKRAILFTDDQQQDSGEMLAGDGWYRRYAQPTVDLKHVPEVITFRLGGYAPQSTWGKGRYHVTGLSDQVFSAVARYVAAG